MRVSNTLSGKKEEFTPQDDEVKMYVCGVTPYDDAHIGHAMSYIIFDFIRRYLRFRGYKVKYVQNVTDIDDKIINRANERGISPRELAEQYTSSFHEDMETLNIMPPDVEPRATEMIPDIIKVVEGLVEKGYAYAAGGSVYFRVRNDADYGQLSHRSLESMMAGARIEVGEEKEHPMDFVLWKASKPGEPAWDSPWGQGRPGWHIECSAMSLKYLGETLDIHGGGQDLIFPHHENEIAQSESFTGVKPFVRYWLHNGLLQLGQEKMSKSLGNLITIKEALAKYSADAIRIFVLSSHYRSPLTYSEEALEAAERGAERLQLAARRKFAGEKTDKQIDIEAYRSKFIEAMEDDFNTPQALAALFDLTWDINKLSDEGYFVLDAQQFLLELADILGLVVSEEQSFEAKLKVESIVASLPILDKNRDIRIILFKQLSEQFEQSSFPALVKVASTTQEYALHVATIHEHIAKSAKYEDIKGTLRALSNTAAANIGSYSELRVQLRQVKQWQSADEIRAKMGELGIILEDTPNGTVVRYKTQLQS
ncbi:MAG TPA: cysteine--tRNA ligase [Dehalococcoidia bacterium]|nr:cysteine--tRNA ligase [Dehalococcoidia bacterium]